MIAVLSLGNMIPVLMKFFTNLEVKGMNNLKTKKKKHKINYILIFQFMSRTSLIESTKSTPKLFLKIPGTINLSFPAAFAKA